MTIIPSPLIAPLHPDDILLFNEVRAAMVAVAKNYRLDLRSVTPMPMPAKSMADRMGDCNASGDIRLVMRCTVDGMWCEGSLSPEEIWDTAAHELAHLRHLHHGSTHFEFQQELAHALRNLRRKEDSRDKLVTKLQKMQRQRDSEAALGNSEAAEAFATAINRMLLEHELHPSDLEYATVATEEPIIELRVQHSIYGLKKRKARSAWQESFARIVARAHLCKFLIRSGSNDVRFVGTRPHATVAEYTRSEFSSQRRRKCPSKRAGTTAFNFARNLGLLRSEVFETMPISGLVIARRGSKRLPLESLSGSKRRDLPQ